VLVVLLWAVGQRLRHAGQVDANTPVNCWIATYPDVVFQVGTDDAHLWESRTLDIGRAVVSHVCCFATVFAQLERWGCNAT